MEKLYVVGVGIFVLIFFNQLLVFWSTFLFQNSSKSRLRNLDSLHVFVSAATKELMWLNDKEEEEVNFDWSDRNTNMTAKKDNYSVRFRRRLCQRC